MPRVPDADSMRPTGDFAGYFFDIRLHGSCIHPGRCDIRLCSAPRTNRPKQIVVSCTLVGKWRGRGLAVADFRLGHGHVGAAQAASSVPQRLNWLPKHPAGRFWMENSQFSGFF